jgi:hypothetical protein
MRRCLNRLAVLALALGSLAAQTWQPRFQFDEAKRSLRILDLAFPSPTTGVASAVLVSKGEVSRVTLISENGGKNWAMVETEDAGPLFFLTRSLGWMAGLKGIYRTATAGKTWDRVSRLTGIRQVYFVDEVRGFAVGDRKQVYQTTDGGRRWLKVAALDKVTTRPERTRFCCIAFRNSNDGVILGSVDNSRLAESPADAVAELDQPERPTVFFALLTRNGQDFEVQQASAFGYPAALLNLDTSQALLLFRFARRFDFPSLVYRIQWENPNLETIFREKDWIVTGMLKAADGSIYLATLRRDGRANQPLFPARVRVYRSTDTKNWQPMDLNYKLQATDVKLAQQPDGSVWLMLDTGSIVELTP